MRQLKRCALVAERDVRASVTSANRRSFLWVLLAYANTLGIGGIRHGHYCKPLLDSSGVRRSCRRQLQRWLHVWSWAVRGHWRDL